MTYLGEDVLDIRPHFAEPPRLRGSRSIDSVDVAHSPRIVSYRGKNPIHVFNFEFLFLSQVEIVAFEDFFYDHAGKWKPFWLPSWHNEIKLNNDAAAAQAFLRVPTVKLGYDANFGTAGGSAKRCGNYVFALTQEGNLDLHNVTAVTNGPTTEDLTISPVTARQLLASYTTVGFLYWVRFIQDELELEYFGPNQAKAKVGMIEVIEVVAEADATESLIDGYNTFLDADYFLAPEAFGPFITAAAWVQGEATFVDPSAAAWDFMDDYSGASPTINGGRGWGANGTIGSVT